MHQVEWLCDDCNKTHFGNCPKVELTMTTATAPINQDIEEILVRHSDFYQEVSYLDDSLSTEQATQALAQRETDLLTYISDLYGLPLKELQRTVELWRKK